jgi:hypothetical protein
VRNGWQHGVLELRVRPDNLGLALYLWGQPAEAWERPDGYPCSPLIQPAQALQLLQLALVAALLGDDDAGPERLELLDQLVVIDPHRRAKQHGPQGPRAAPTRIPFVLIDPLDQAAEHVEAEECPVTSGRPDSKPIVEPVRERQPRSFVVAHTIKLARASRSRCGANLRLRRPGSWLSRIRWRPRATPF